MGGCSAVDCTNHSKNGVRLFRFPRDPERRKRWAINCRRSNWEPGPGAELCIAHFEESQFEINRADKWKKLKPTAVPTRFDVGLPNTPKPVANKRKKGLGLTKRDPLFHNYAKSSKEAHFEESRLQINQADSWKKLPQAAGPDSAKLPKPLASEHNYAKSSKETGEAMENGSTTSSQPTEDVPNNIDISGPANYTTIAALRDQISTLERENTSLKSELEVQKKSMLRFLSAEQIEIAKTERQSISQWSSEGIIKGLKLRSALGKRGYNFLRSTGYPTPQFTQ